MSPKPGTSNDPRSAEQRAEELMQRVVSDGSRMVTRVFGRVREEVEDIVAEARTKHDSSSEPTRK